MEFFFGVVRSGHGGLRLRPPLDIHILRQTDPISSSAAGSTRRASPLADQESVNLCGRWVGAMLYESMSQVGGSPRYVGACSTIPHAVQWVSSATARML